jgi:hypothetical protein
MKETFATGEYKSPLEKASELGKILSRGGITLSDNKTAFTKKGIMR